MMKVKDIYNVIWMLPKDTEIQSINELLELSVKYQYPLDELKNVSIRTFNAVLRASQKIDSFQQYSPYKIYCTMDLVEIYKENGEKGLLRIKNLGKQGVSELITELKRLHPNANIS